MPLRFKVFSSFLSFLNRDHHVIGTERGDFILTGSGDDTLEGRGGADFINARDGDNVVDGGSGADFILAGRGNNTVFGGSGSDFIRVGRGQNLIDGGEGNDTIFAGTGRDTIEGGAGSDVIRSGSGDDVVAGGAGNDRLALGRGQDVAVYVLADNVGDRDYYNGGKGTDTLRLVLTKAEWQQEAVQADIAAFLSHLEAGSGRFGARFSFDAFDLKVKGFEALEVVVDGDFLDPRDAAVSLLNQSVSVQEGRAVAGNVLNGSDVPDLVRSVALVQDVANGRLSLNPDGSFSFDAGAAFEALGVGQSATETFVVEVTDSDGDTARATTTITVFGENDTPEALSDRVEATEDTTLVLPASDLLRNDTDIDGDALTLVSVDALSAQGGAVSLSVSGDVVYTPVANFNGIDTFIYTVNDGQGGVATATVTVDVQSVNDAPVAAPQAFTVNEDATLPVLASQLLLGATDVDGDTVSIQSVASTSANGGSISQTATGAWAYTPPSDFNGIDTFTYTINDGQGGLSTASVTVTVSAVNDAPVAANDRFAGRENSPVTILAAEILSNDVDVDNDLLTLSAVDATSANNGTVTLNVDGSVTYTPQGGFFGTDTFGVTVSDGNGGISRSTVTIDVEEVNAAPTAVNDTLSSNGQPASANVLSNDSDLDGDVLRVTGLTALAGDSDGDGFEVTLTNASATADGMQYDLQFSDGVTTVNATLDVATSGTVTLTPGAGFSDLPAQQQITGQLSLTISDGAATSSSVLEVTLEGQNAAPIPGTDRLSVFEGESVRVSLQALLANDVDPEGQSLKITNVTVDNGLAFIQTGNLLYFPAFSTDALTAGEIATDIVTYTVTDGQGGVAQGTINVTITGLDDGPGVQLTNVGLGYGGFSILGAYNNEYAGYIVQEIGDVNGDGFEDVVVGGLVESATYVVFGRADGAQIDLADVRAGNGGFLLSEEALDIRIVSAAGDVNGDGLADIVIGAPANDPNPADSTQIDWNLDRYIDGFDRGEISSFASLNGITTDGVGRIVDSETNTGQAFVVFGKSTTEAVDYTAIASGTGGGFAINGYELFGLLGDGVSGAGDINGDGLADIIVGSPGASTSTRVLYRDGTNVSFNVDAYSGNRDNGGSTYVIYGRTETTALEIRDIDAGSDDGFSFSGLRFDQLGGGVTGLGDVNGDGYDDFMVMGGDAREQEVGLPLSPTEEVYSISYIVYGGANPTSTEVYSSQNPYFLPYTYMRLFAEDNPYAIFSSTTGQQATLRAAVASSDWGRARLLEDEQAALLRVVSDQSSFSGLSSAEQNELLHFVEFTLRTWGRAESFVASDFVVALGVAYDTLLAEDGEQGTSLIGSDANVDLQRWLDVRNPEIGLQGDRGFSILGLHADAPNAALNEVAALGDVNGDGFADMLVTVADRGTSYVVLGGTTGDDVTLSEIEAGTGGFTVSGAMMSAQGIGDFNADGLDDFIVSPLSGGKVYVVFGKTDTSAISLADLTNNIGGFQIALDTSILTVSGAGDVDGDGFDDILVGAAFSDTAGRNNGEAFVVYGNAQDNFSINSQVTGDGDDRVNGTAAADRIVGGRGDDTISGGGGADALNGGAGDDLISIADSGFVRVNGGTGFDTLRLDASGQSLLLATLPDTRLDGIEAVDLADANNAVSLSRDAVLRLSETSNTLRVQGGTTDTYSFADNGWTAAGSVVHNGVIFDVFQNGLARVEMQQGIREIRTEYDLRDIASGLSSSGVALLDAGASIAAAVAGGFDANGDGIDDLAFALDDGAGNARISLVLGGNGLASGSLTAAAVYTVGGLSPASEGPEIGVAGLGDLNSDGYDEFVFADGSASYVVAGAASPGSVSTGGLQSNTGGFALTGDTDSARVVALGDLNGDGVADFMTQTATADGDAQATVILGGQVQSTANLGALSDTQAFNIFSSNSVTAGLLEFAYAGDINGDGYDDVIASSLTAGGVPGGVFPLLKGGAFVVFGSDSPADVDLATLQAGGAATGAYIEGSFFDIIRTATGVGDFNGDGFGDVIVQTNDQLFMVHGGQNFADLTIDDLIAGTGGYAITGSYGASGAFEVQGLGDFNGDGFDDLAVITRNVTTPENSETFVIYGRAGTDAFDVDALANGVEGFRITGGPIQSLAAAGDVNGDGRADLVAGVEQFDDGSETLSGGFLIFG